MDCETLSGQEVAVCCRWTWAQERKAALSCEVGWHCSDIVHKFALILSQVGWVDARLICDWAMALKDGCKGPCDDALDSCGDLPGRWWSWPCWSWPAARHRQLQPDV